MKLFISYSHIDETYISDFIKHLSPLVENFKLEKWYDRKILAGENFQDTIDNNLNDADLICLFISHNFLSSKACLYEKDNAIDLMFKKNTKVVPIILSECGWLDFKEISNLLALPTDGKALETYKPNINSGYKIIYDGLKEIIQESLTNRKVEINSDFYDFLNSTELLTRAHSQKENVLLDDIFVFPDLTKYINTKDFEHKISSSHLLDEVLKKKKIVIQGENQSGKTTLLKKMFLQLRNNKFFPVYLLSKENQFQGNFENIITEAFQNQYNGINYSKVELSTIIPMIDNFHMLKNKEKLIEELNIFTLQILVVDDIFKFNFKDDKLVRNFSFYKINEFKPSLRNELLKKWILLTDKQSNDLKNESELYEQLDKKTELVNTTLGKVFSSGIMPSYPFFILTIVSAFDTQKPLDQEITSQGYCYQALIYMYLRKKGVKNEEIDIYINLLSEFAFDLYDNKKVELSNVDFDKFFKKYDDNFNFPLKINIVLENLKDISILSKDSTNNICFSYTYLYYFFVARYIAEHIEDNKKTIDHIINNLHVNENAYIAVFISHHSKNLYILDEIILSALILFENYKPSTLNKLDLSFFDDELKSIENAVLKQTKSPELIREERLAIDDTEEQETIEKSTQEKINGNRTIQIEHDYENLDDDSNALTINLRRSIKTVEVMGSIIKNRSGSIPKKKLQEIFREGMNVHLKILTSFFELIKEKDQQDSIVEFISIQIAKMIEKKGKEREPSKEEVEKISQNVFWNMNFGVIFGLISKIIHSLGSNNLLDIVDNVCNEINTPATQIVKQGIYMWYGKNLQIDNIATLFEDKQFSETAKQVLKHKIVEHCSVHNIDYKNIQRIESSLKIPLHILNEKKFNRHDK